MSRAWLYTDLELSVAQRLDTTRAVGALFSCRAPGKASANEDAALLLEHAESGLVAAIADGAGGHAAGGAASATAIAALAEAFASPDEPLARAAVLNGFEHAHAAIRDTGTGAATTLAVVELSQRNLRTYHAGDTGILVVGGRGRIKLQTLFHSPTGYGVEAGLIDAEAALHHAERHVVSNVLGREPMSVEIGSPLALAPRDTVVLASDGLFDNLYLDEIARIAPYGTVALACQTLANLALARMAAPGGGQPSKADDLSIMVLRPSS